MIIIGWLFGIFVLPLILGVLLARALRMKESARRFSITLFALFLAAAPFINQWMDGKSLKDAFRLGVDLAGGTNLVYEVDEQQAKESGKDISNSAFLNQSMDELVRAIVRRVNPSGTEEVTVRKVGSNRVEIIIPGADSDYVQVMKDQITRLGSLQFAILASKHDTQNDHQRIIAEALRLKDKDVYDGDVRRSAWVPVARIADGEHAGELKDIKPGPFDVYREREVDGKKVLEFLVILDPPDEQVDGRYLINARRTMDENGGVAVGFTFNPRGGFLFSQLTGKYSPKTDGNEYRLAAILDGEIHSAANIKTMIHENGQISGSFTNEEVDELVSVLNAGALELPLKKEPISEYTISPTLGVDVQEKGKDAIIVAAITVLAFMIVYYWVSGVIADICLIVNVVLVLGVMALIDATFTLPGLAGLVLTIGMAVDANVLIFERIREELQRGSSLRMSIHNGFARAFTTIIDANLTTLISAVILYARGTEQVKGFAAMLFIGIVMSMFSALYVGRLLFDILERQGLLSEKTLLGRSLIGKTEWDFVGKQKLASVLSLALIIGGMGVLVKRGNDNLDIDFTGGAMVTFQFEDNPGIEEARSALATEFGNDISVERLVVPDPEDPSKEDIFFRLRTKNQDIEEVREKVNKAFANSTHKLKKTTLTFGELKKIADSASDSKKADGSQKTEAEKTADQAKTKDPFVGGTQVTLKFSDEVAIDAALDYVINAYAKVTKKKTDEIKNADALVALEGVGGSGVTADESSVKRYTEMVMKIRSEVGQDVVKATLEEMQKEMASLPVLSEVNTFDASVAGEAKVNAVMAMLIALVAIVAYIWIRFQQIAFGLAAVVALVHDVLVVLGLVAIASVLSSTPVGPLFMLTDFKINLSMIAAFLTIIGYSLNDTIVVFDRIREVRGKNPDIKPEMVNTSLNQTLSRTLLTSITTMLVVIVLYIIGGEGLHGFAFCLVAGVAVGTYSSIYVASPVLLKLAKRTT